MHWSFFFALTRYLSHAVLYLVSTKYLAHETLHYFTRLFFLLGTHVLCICYVNFLHYCRILFYPRTLVLAIHGIHDKYFRIVFFFRIINIILVFVLFLRKTSLKQNFAHRYSYKRGFCFWLILTFDTIWKLLAIQKQSS